MSLLRFLWLLVPFGLICEASNDHRLPKSVVPRNYRLELVTHLQEFKFNGIVHIIVSKFFCLSLDNMEKTINTNFGSD